MAEILVYGKPACPQCSAVKRHLERREIPYTYRDVTLNYPADADRVRILGYSAVPVVVLGDLHHQGYRPDRLDEYALLAATAEDTTHLEAAAVTELTDPDEAPCARCGFPTSGLLDDDGVCPDCVCAEGGAA